MVKLDDYLYVILYVTCECTMCTMCKWIDVCCMVCVNVIIYKCIGLYECVYVCFQSITSIAISQPSIKCIDRY